MLEELENIDDDCDKHGITFVKTRDFSVADGYGVHEYPALVYFEGGIPNVFEGEKKTKIKINDLYSIIIKCICSLFYNHLIICNLSGELSEEEEVLQWLITQKTEDRIELITRQMLETMVEETQYLAVYFCKLQTQIRKTLFHNVTQYKLLSPGTTTAPPNHTAPPTPNQIQ